MTIQSTDNDHGNSFEYRLREVSDEEIINILRFRKHFQPHAVREAIKEAIKRGIISSVEDLEKDNFKPQPLPPKSLFPVSAVQSQNITVLKSLCRIIYGVSIIPIIFGILQIMNHKLIPAVIALLFGLLIIFITYKLDKEKKTIYSQILLFVNIPSIGYAFYTLFANGKPAKMDIFAAAVIIVVILYATLYLHKLNTHINKNSGRL
jgi:hypothetical protein